MSEPSSNCYCLIGYGTRRGGVNYKLVVGMYVHPKDTPHFTDLEWEPEDENERLIFYSVLRKDEPLFRNVKGEMVDPRKEFEDEYWYSLIQDFPEVTSILSSPRYDANTGRRWSSPIHEQRVRKNKGDT